MTTTHHENPASLIPNEMLIFAGAACTTPVQFSSRGTDLWVLLAEDEHPYTPQYRRAPGVPDRTATLEALTAAIDGLVAARDRLLASRMLQERL